MKIKLLNVLKENKMIQFAIDGPMITGQPWTVTIQLGGESGSFLS